jgi:hypothetical protein
LPEVLEAISSQRPIFVVEGEKDADNLAKLGIVGTCNAGGALKWRREHAEFLRGADAIIVADNDSIGKLHAASVAKSLTSIAAHVRMLELPGLPNKGDVSDWLEAGGTAEQLWLLAEHAPTWTPTQFAQTNGSESGVDRGGLRYTLFRDIDPAPRKEWLCHNLFGAGELSCVFGQPGTCKSTLVGDFGAHVAAGMNWFGRATKGGGVLYVAAERSLLIKRRMAAFKKHHNVNDIPMAILSGQPDLRSSDADAMQIIENAKRLEDEYGYAVTLIILETVSRLLAGGDENSSKDMGALVRMFGAMQEATDAHIMSVHHIPTDGAPRLRGHGSLLGACDVTARTEHRGSNRTLSIDKVNDGPEGELLAFTLKSIELSCHDKITTTAPVIVPTEPRAQSPIETELTPNQRTMFSIVHAAGSKGLTTESLNEKAREAGLGGKRKADLYDLREALKRKHLLHFLDDKWVVNHKERGVDTGYGA